MKKDTKNTSAKKNSSNFGETIGTISNILGGTNGKNLQGLYNMGQVASKLVKFFI